MEVCEILTPYFIPKNSIKRKEKTIKRIMNFGNSGIQKYKTALERHKEHMEHKIPIQDAPTFLSNSKFFSN